MGILTRDLQTQPVQDWHVEYPTPQRLGFVAEAIEAHRARLLESMVDRWTILPAIVRRVLGQDVDRMARLRSGEPLAIIDGYIFRGEAEDPYDLRGGWLCVMTRHNGWREVRNVEQLGLIASREPLARWER